MMNCGRAPIRAGYRWRRPGAETLITLYKFDENWEHYRSTFKQSQSLTLQCENIDETYRIYKERGVEFLGEPETQFWGRFVMMKDWRRQYADSGTGVKLADLVDLSRQVGGLLTRGDFSICAAESCTGGLILSTLTDISRQFRLCRGRRRHLFQRGQDAAPGRA